MNLQESLNQFTAPVYGKTRRTADTYQTVARYCRQNLIRLVSEYLAVRNDQQLLREIRNDIDNYLRRYHEYCIKQRDGMQAHYHEVGADDECDFEHLIPAARIRDLLLANAITVEQAQRTYCETESCQTCPAERSRLGQHHSRHVGAVPAIQSGVLSPV
jgi:hypothetical protein